MQIKKVEISNIFGIQSASLSFNTNHSAFLVQFDSDCPVQSAFSTAIQLITSSKYASIESLAPLNNVLCGFVRITLLSNKEFQCDSSNSRESGMHKCQIIACRNFVTNPNEIQFSIDDKPWRFCSPTVFHARFRTNIDFIIPYLDKSGNILCGNLLGWIFTNFDYKCNYDQQFFKDYIETCLIQNRQNSSAFLQKLISGFFTTLNVYSVEQKCHLMKLCNDIRTIFEFLSFDEYTVWFFIPYKGNLIDIKDVTIKELNLNKIHTYIQLKAKNSDLTPWLCMDQLLKDLLTTSLDLALGYMCKHDIIFIRGLDGVQEHQTIELCKDKYLRGVETGNLDIRRKKNYLQRIVDVCNSMKINVIIEFSAKLLLPTINVNIIRCSKNADAIWEMSVSET